MNSSNHLIPVPVGILKCEKGEKYFRRQSDREQTLLLYKKCHFCKYYYPYESFRAHSSYCIGHPSPIGITSPDSDSEEGEVVDTNDDDNNDKNTTNDNVILWSDDDDNDNETLKKNRYENDDILDFTRNRYESTISNRGFGEHIHEKIQKNQQFSDFWNTDFKPSPKRKESLDRQEILKSLGPEFESTISLMSDQEIRENFGAQLSDFKSNSSRSSEKTGGFSQKQVSFGPNSLATSEKTVGFSPSNNGSGHSWSTHSPTYCTPDDYSLSPVRIHDYSLSPTRIQKTEKEKWDVGMDMDLDTPAVVESKSSKEEDSELEQRYRSELHEMGKTPMIHCLQNLVDLMKMAYAVQTEDSRRVFKMILDSYLDSMRQLDIPISKIVSSCKEKHVPDDLVVNLIAFHLAKDGHLLLEDDILDIFETCITENYLPLQTEIERRLFKDYSIISLFFSSRKYFKCHKKVLDILSKMPLYEVTEIPDFALLSNDKKNALTSTCISYYKMSQ